MKRMEVTEKTIGENKFYLKPFPAFAAVNISGELAATLTPILGGLASVVSGNDGNSLKEKAAGLMDADIDEALPAFTKSLSGLSGANLERLMRKLLTESSNISVEGPITNGEVVVMSKELADEVFCGDVQDMFILAFEVIRLNFNGFFKKIAGLSGKVGSASPKTPRKVI